MLNSFASAFEWFGTPDGALLVWGLFSRSVGFVFFVALASLALQTRGLYGRRGLTPLHGLLARYRAHYGVLPGMWYHPSLLWLVGTSDVALLTITVLGAACGVMAMVGGPWSPASLAFAWAVMLSYDSTVTGYPWDSLLLETGFLAIWLPATSLPLQLSAAALSATGRPSNLHSFAFRWLLARVLLGFAKTKFTGSGWRDRLYIKNFILTQPMVTPVGLLAWRALPDVAWIGALIGMFVVEVFVPFGLLFCGIPRVLAGASIAGLMAGIQLTGNYGYFNILTTALCIPALAHAEALTFSAADVELPLRNAASPAAVLANTVLSVTLLLYLLPVSFLNVTGNSWTNMSMWFWGGLHRGGPAGGLMGLIVVPFRAIALIMRSLSEWRLSAAYGVFPPNTAPGQRYAVVYEGSEDGVTWHRYEFAYYLSGPRSAPRFVAPYHPRFDHAIFYEGGPFLGMLINVLSNTPYEYPHSGASSYRVLYRLLEGGVDNQRMTRVVFRSNPFPDPSRPPQYVRSLVCHYLPESYDVASRTGVYWIERVVGLHHAPISLRSLAPQTVLPPLPSDDAVSRGETRRSRVKLSSVTGGDASGPRAHVDTPSVHSSLDECWPLNDRMPEPEEFFAECTTWRHRAGVASGGVTRAEEEEAWSFIEALRTAAAEAALEACSGDEAVDVNWEAFNSRIAARAAATTGSAAPRRRRSSSRNRDRSSNAHQRRQRGSSASAPTAPLAAVLPQETPTALADRFARSFVRLPLERVATAAGAAAVLAVDIRSPLPAGAAASVLCWTALPGAVRRVRASYTMAQIVRIRRTIARMTTPLLRAAERIFDRSTPTRAALDAEENDAGLSNSHKYAAEVAEMLSPSVKWVDSTVVAATAHGLPLASDDASRGPIYYYAGNDDAPRSLYGGGVAGAMRTPMRWLMHAHSLMLVGGRDAYTRVLRGLTGEERVSAPPLLVGDHDYLGRLPRAALWSALIDDGRAHPADMATESGLFLQFTLTFDVTVAVATAARRLMTAVNVPESRSGEPTSLAPSPIFVVHRMIAHPGLCVAHVPHAARLAPSAAATSVSADGRLPVMDVPLWTPSVDHSQWDFHGTLMERAAASARKIE